MFWPSTSISKVSAAMLVEHVAALPPTDAWEYEFSWPGERVLAAKHGPSVRLTAALHRRDLTNRFPVIAAALAKIAAESVVLDGVIRTIDGASAALLVGTPAAPPLGAIRLVATDILWLDDIDLRTLSLRERKERLGSAVIGTGILLGAPLTLSAAQMLRTAERIGADGVIAKRRDSKYRPFGRSGDWVRVNVQPNATAKTKSGAANQSELDRAASERNGAAFGGWGHAVG